MSTEVCNKDAEMPLSLRTVSVVQEHHTGHQKDTWSAATEIDFVLKAYYLDERFVFLSANARRNLLPFSLGFKKVRKSKSSKKAETEPRIMQTLPQSMSQQNK